MKVVIVSNYLVELDNLVHTINVTYPDWQVRRFTDPFMSAKFIQQNSADLALIATRLRPVNGNELLRVLRRVKPELPIVLFADAEEYRAIARDAGANDYFVMPVTAESLRKFERLKKKVK